MDAHGGLPKLTQLFPRDDYEGDTTVDIIAVHGIETQSPKTWTAYERDEEPRGRAVNWLHDENMLPRVLPQARMCTYDYNSRCYSDNAQEVDILDLGQTFLEVLCTAYHKHIGRRPLAFVGSCFGGIVVAQALERAFRSETKYADLLKNTAGVIFLGSPLRGTATAGPAQQLAYLRGAFGKSTSETLLNGLKENDVHLRTVIQDFAEGAISRKLQIRCFYETQQTNIANAAMNRWIAQIFPKTMLVSRESACLDGHKRLSLDVRHAMMNKFRGPDDANFVMVSECLRDIIENTSINRARTGRELSCLRCLTSNYKDNKDRNALRVPETCKWVLNNPKFLNWRQDPTSKRSLLWITADPGCGKSTLSRSLVDEDLLTTDDGMKSTCYFFFKDEDSARRSPSIALSAMLHQLFVQKPHLLKHAITKFEENGDKVNIMFGTLWDILMNAAADPSAGDIICLLDALDECDGEERKPLIEKLGQLHSNSTESRIKLKFLVTSRPYHDIASTFYRGIDDLSSINLQGEYESDTISKEIGLVIDHEVPKIARARRYRLEPEVVSALIDKLKSMPHQTYLWLHLIFDLIRKSLESSRIRLEKLVDKIPSTVDDAYENLLQRIEDSADAEKARRLLHIVLCAVRPLTLAEMNDALALDEKLRSGEQCHSYLELDLVPEEQLCENIRSICGLFISVTDSRIYLIHQTAKEFLISKDDFADRHRNARSGKDVWKHSLSLPESNRILMTIAVHYLSLSGFPVEFENMVDILMTDAPWNIRDAYHFFEARKRLKSHPRWSFFLYAADHWIHHFQESQTEEPDVVVELALDLCNPRSVRYKRWFRVCELSTRHDQSLSKASTSLIIASCFGLYPVVKLALAREKTSVSDSQNYFKDTPLSVAADNGRTKVIELLTKQKGIKINSKNVYGDSPLGLAAENGHLEAVRLLSKQKGIKINSKNDFEDSPLGLAANNCHLEAVRLLSKQKGIKINGKNLFGDSPLGLAAKNGHLEAVRLLSKQKGIKINGENMFGDSPLGLAAKNGHLEAVRLLSKQKGIKINAKDKFGYSPLSWAAENGHTEVVEFLLEQPGIEVDTGGGSNREPTLLDMAAKGGHLNIVKIILAYEVNIDGATRRDLLKALSWAVKNWDLAMIKLLVGDGGVANDIFSNDHERRLTKAMRNGDTAFAEMLIGYDADVNAKDGFGQTPLSLAASRGDTSMVELLLRNNAEVNHQDEDGWLARLNAEFDKQTWCGSTALARAAEKQHLDVCKLLLDRNADIDLGDKRGHTPLARAVHKGSLDACKLLLDRNATIDIPNDDGLKPIELAESMGHADIVDLLRQENEKRKRGQ
ncbi:MAG: hypothetical protein M1831_000257 [Alyxoria varia]|nr:MAG: hypothetical protein M1831_000257 [Alyxoria varia]